MPYIEGSRFRSGVEAGVSGDSTGYGPAVYSSTANGGTPTGGTTGFGAGTIQPGGLAIAASSKKLFINTGTQANPTWTVVGAQT